MGAARNRKSLGTGPAGSYCAPMRSELAGLAALAWRDLTGDDVPAVAALAGRCLAADGGLPLVASPPFVGSRFAADGGTGWGATDPAGALVAAGAVRPQTIAGVRRGTFLGLVDPGWRGRGIGAQLIDRGLAAAGTLAERVAVETESLTDEAAALFADRGLRQVLAEDVLRRDLTVSLVDVAPPAGDVTLLPWAAVPADRFFDAYRAAFRDRPGFPGWSKSRWVDWTAGDDEFRPQWSFLAVDSVDGDLGFVTCADGWIVQVGVRPEWRGRGLGAFLVTESLRRMRDDGAAEALLDVNVDNPAGGLYRRLGFATVGRRARFEPVD